MNEKALLQRVRRMARKQDMTINKLRESSRDYLQYGIYMVCDLRTGYLLGYGFESAQELVDYFKNA